AHGTRADVRVLGVEIEERGTLRAAVALSARVRLGGTRALAVTARVEFFAGSTVARVALTLRNPSKAGHSGGFWELGASGSALLRDVSLTLTLAPDDAPSTVCCSEEPGFAMTPVAAPLEIYQDSSGGQNRRSS